MTERAFYVHPNALVASSRIGADTRIWAFCNVQERAVIGRECNVCDHCFIENNAIIGDRVTIKNGVSLWDGMVIEDDVFIGPHAVFTNDIYPRSKVYHDQPDRTLIKQGATIGAAAVIVAGHTIGRYAFVGAGAVLTKNAPDNSLWLGNPARQVGFVCRCAQRLSLDMARATLQTANCKCGRSYELLDGRLTER